MMKMMSSTISNSSSSSSSAAIFSPKEEGGFLKELCAYFSPFPSGTRDRDITEEGLQEIICRWGWSWSPSNKELEHYYFFYNLLLNENLTEGLVKAALHHFPEAASVETISSHLTKKTALLVILTNPKVTLNMVKIVVGLHPPIVACKDDNNVTAFHCLCSNEDVDATARMEILQFLLQKNRDMLQIATIDEGTLPIHWASGLPRNSIPVAFMQKLIDAYPESVMKSGYTTDVPSPLHIVCRHCNLPLAKTLVKANPNCLGGFSSSFGYPIKSVLFGENNTSHLVADLVRFLVNYPGSKVAFQEHPGGYLPLHLFCIAASRKWDGENRRWQRLVEAHHPTSLELIKILFDAFPGAIECSTLKRDMDMQGIERERKFHPKVMEFLNYHRVFTLPYSELKERYNPLPLHFAIMKNECLGSIKLLVGGNPDAVHIPYKDGAMPLHLAIQHHRCPEVIRYLVDKNTEQTLGIADLEGNTALHLACRSAKCEIIAILLDKHGAVSVSKQNRNGKLPIELLLFETDADLDRQSTMYTDSIFRLVRAHPPVVMGTF